MHIKNIFPQKLKNIYHLGQAALANFIYGFPARKIKIIGVTGTNGKTTTCQMIAKILEEAGHKVAMASTINFKLGEKEWVNATKFTTLSSFQVQKFMKKAVDEKCDYLVLETSSHSLDQYRVWGINYDIAVITNVTREHLDYHKTMDEYHLAKLRLFRNAKAAVVNLDMEKPEEFLKFGDEKYGYSMKYNVSSIMYKKLKEKINGLKLINAENVNLGIKNTSYIIHDTLYTLNLPGRFNVENALAATCVGISEGVSLEKIKTALEKMKNIPGRLEYIPNNKSLDIIVDYAVTPDSLEKLYKLLGIMVRSKMSSNKYDLNKIIAVLGACGDRDRGKRPIMGEIASEYCDYIILTNEDPYSEDPWRIINEIAKGIKNKEDEKNFWKIMDRREAIKKALRLAKPGDLVIITGKGAEETMAIGEKRIPWNDKKVILEELKNLEN